jgi:hypothetical protein
MIGGRERIVRQDPNAVIAIASWKKWYNKAMSGISNVRKQI